ncbi:hypothetical protein CBS101457_005687 [Exobasidium rhododendri]|nr:hypothetical protein CBS101457_005687 [Exobasidium rhododendri]
MPLARSKSPSPSVSRSKVTEPTFKKLLAANMRNCRLPNPLMRSRCAMTMFGDFFHAAPVLPHSFWSTARMHEWLYYAGVIPNGGVDTQELVKFKYTDLNILWLHTMFAYWMEPTKGQFIIVPELHQLIQQAEEILTEINEDTNATFRNFTAVKLLDNWDESVPVENGDPVKVFPYSTWFAMSDASLASWSFANYKHMFLARDAEVHHTAIAGREEEIPMPYSPPLPTGWRWCLSPIITSAVAWKAIGSCCPASRMTSEAKHQLELIDYYLRLCECETPSSWRTLRQPRSLNDLSAMEPGLDAEEEAEEEEVQEVQKVQKVHEVQEVQESEKEEEDTGTLEERYDEIQDWRRENDGLLDDFEPLLVKAEEIYVAKARKIIRVAFEEQAEEKGFSAAMYWLRSNDRIDSIDDRVDRLRKRWMAKAIKMTDEYESIPQGLDRDGLQQWQRDVSEANSGSE